MEVKLSHVMLHVGGLQGRRCGQKYEASWIKPTIKLQVRL
jgi:hypothetical protein